LQLGDRPQLVGVSSSAAYLPLPRAEYYGASKAAMSYFLHALRLAWQQKGISVHVVSPGFVKTPLTDKNDFAMPCQISAELAADYIVKGLAARRRDIHFPHRFTIWLKMLSALPLYIQQQLTGRLKKQ
jgi:short-subunit dehydrogenase